VAQGLVTRASEQMTFAVVMSYYAIMPDHDDGRRQETKGDPVGVKELARTRSRKVTLNATSRAVPVCTTGTEIVSCMKQLRGKRAGHVQKRSARRAALSST